MVRTEVESSCIRAVGYDPAGRVLEIEFVSGSVYRYSGVPERVRAELMAAPSHGHYFSTYVRGRFAYRRTD